MSRRTPPETRHYPDLVRTLPAMDGKVVLITGCSSGMGLVLARTCGRLGARVIMLNRPSQRADAALALLQKDGSDALSVPCDLLSFSSVRAAGATLRRHLDDTGADVLCNNAGIMGMPDTASPDGFDVQMQANHLSHFLLTHEVWPLLEKAAAERGEARVVNHSSGARNRPKRPLMAQYLGPNGGKLGGDGFPGMQKWIRYQQSKLANLMFTYALADHAGARPGNKVKSLCAHPGPVDSGLQDKTAQAGGTRLLDRYVLASTLKIAQSTEDGTCGIARCSCEPGVGNGSFYGPDPQKRTGPAVLLPPERNKAWEDLVWDESLRATGITAFFG